MATINSVFSLSFSQKESSKGSKISLSRVRALPLCVAAEGSVHYFWVYFYFLSFFCDTYFSAIRGYSRVMKFCTEFKSQPSDEKIPLVSMGGRTEGQACADP